MTHGVRNGEVMPEQFAKYGKRIATRSQVTISFGPQVFVNAGYRIDSSTAPKSIDYVQSAGDGVADDQKGIYELDVDTLRTFMSFAGAERPTEFSPEPGDGRMLAVWKKNR